MLSSARAVGRDDGRGAPVGDGLSQAVGVIGGLGHDDAGGHVLDQRQGLGSIFRDRPQHQTT